MEDWSLEGTGDWGFLEGKFKGLSGVSFRRGMRNEDETSGSIFSILAGQSGGKGKS